MGDDAFEWDSFVCHASEDKATFVSPLAEALRAEGFRIWYDGFVLEVGDSLRRRIDEGLKHSRFGVVVLSRAFFAKDWPQWELDGLAAREMDSDDKVILPVWHGVTKEDVAGYSPSLAGKVAARSEEGLGSVVRQLAAVLRRPVSPSARPSPRERREAKGRARSSSSVAGPATFSERLRRQQDKEREEREAQAARAKWQERRDELVLAGSQDAIVAVCAEIARLATEARGPR